MGEERTEYGVNTSTNPMNQKPGTTRRTIFCAAVSNIHGRADNYMEL